ncbi:hypothetical protein WICPIJ_004481 [Wickerhamomyces pijperi]|uniref:Uncharacterized protein n=1 Tax=Wickerhamomyces pijperi TaxID=599730 RepID=A0A9P8TMV4_WICPI|nr:hypothetical protein WICPIJ_004481 [Wickerhamomyces pijperi]
MFSEIKPLNFKKREWNEVRIKYSFMKLDSLALVSNESIMFGEPVVVQDEEVGRLLNDEVYKVRLLVDVVNGTTCTVVDGLKQGVTSLSNKIITTQFDES